MDASDILFLLFFWFGFPIGRAMAQIDRSLFVRRSSAAQMSLVVLRVVLVWGGIWWLTQQVAPVSYPDNIAQGLIDSMMKATAWNYMFEMFGFGDWWKAKTWK